MGIDFHRLIWAALLIALASAAVPARAATFVVNSTADAGDFDLKDNVPDADAAAGSQITLRCAIENANLTPEPDEIRFELPASDPGHFYYKNDNTAGQITLANRAAAAADDSAIADKDPDYPHSWWTIIPRSSLPAITAPLLIDGFAQSGAQPNKSAAAIDAVLRVEIDGAELSDLSASASLQGGDPHRAGLRLRADGCTIRGLAVNSFLNEGSPGIVIESSQCAVEGCLVGVDPSGTRARGNFFGVLISNLARKPDAARNNRVGAAPDPVAAAAARNLISGNYGAGVVVRGEARLNVVAGNFIGPDRAGGPGIGNGHGVLITAGANRIGGTASADANLIAFNLKDGVEIATADDHFGIDNAVIGNFIYDNAGLAINLTPPLETTNTVTPNDRGDVDEGPNHLQNAPELEYASGLSLPLLGIAGSTTIKGTLKSNPDLDFRIEFFASPAADPSGFGEGQQYLGSLKVNTGAGRIADFQFQPAVAIPGGYAITATATEMDSTGGFKSTSEFSNAVTLGNWLPTAIAGALALIAVVIVWIVVTRLRSARRA